MERLVTVKDVQQRYGCSLPTARKYLRQMFHYESPLAAPMWAFAEWEENRAVYPQNISSKLRVHYHDKTERIRVPRKREG